MSESQDSTAAADSEAQFAKKELQSMTPGQLVVREGAPPHAGEKPATLQQRVPAGESVFETVRNWQEGAKNVVFKAKKLIETEKDRWCLGKCPNLWTQNNQSKKFEQLIEMISGLLKEESKFVSDISYREIPRVIDTPSSRDCVALNSRTSMLNDMKKTLEDPKMYMIGVHGMDGVGKKALVKDPTPHDVPARLLRRQHHPPPHQRWCLNLGFLQTTWSQFCFYIEKLIFIDVEEWRKLGAAGWRSKPQPG
ncbi:hypothetical protein Fmac_025147 [Flemingia macrophylla]|uniref:Uncharacterized protein n=1 Tax=Flemingia macrophylla TaxID=520843 RepID=A0ABD1LRF3_9FABA